MLTRRDQVQAYRFAQARVQTALLDGQPDRVDVPMRRQRVAAVVSVGVAALAAAGFWVYGLMRPGGNDGWRARDTVVVEKETGARYVYDVNDERLHPVLNYASARLVLRAQKVTMREFSAASLAGAPRGAARGVADLPDALPGPQGLLTGPWLMCSGSVSGGEPWSTLSLGGAVSGKRLDHDRALLVAVPDGHQYLLWHDTRLEVRQPALAVLGLGGVAPLTVTPEWLNAAVAPGPDLAAPDVPQAGARAPYTLGGRAVKVGQIVSVDAADGVRHQYYLATAEGLAPVREVVANLLLADPRLVAVYWGGVRRAPVQVSAADIATAPLRTAKVTPDGFPETVPELVHTSPAQDAPGVVCGARTEATDKNVQTAVYVDSAVTPPQQAATPGPRRALVPPGRAAVVQPLLHPGVVSDALFVVTDTGIKYPVPTPEVLGFLGLGGVTPVPLPSGIVAAIPTGPLLDPQAANTDLPVPTSAADGLAALPTSALPPGGAASASPSVQPTKKKATPTTTKRKPRTSTPPSTSNAG